jgi:adenylyltransferase/sulfurtransferase
MDISIIGIKNTGSRETINKLIDYEEFCNSPSHKKEILPMKEITVQQLQELKQSGEDFQLIDVREEYEYETGNLNGELIPMSEIPQQLENISKSKKVIIHCRSGGRSGQVIQWLEQNHNLSNLYNLKGGIIAWSREIDPSVNV